MKHQELKDRFEHDLTDFTKAEIEHIWEILHDSICSYIKGCIYDASEEYREEINDLEWEKTQLESRVNELEEKIEEIESKMESAKPQTLKDEFKMQWICENWDKIPGI